MPANGIKFALLARRMRSLLLAVTLALSAMTLVAQDWRGELEMIDNDLRTQHYGHARKWSIKMINSMCDNLGTGQDAMYTLALTVAYRAMAEAGLQKPADADWYAHVAFSLFPPLAQRDWSAYGDVGEWLRQSKHESDVKAADGATSPVPREKSAPKCPLGAVKGSYFQAVTVAGIVDSDGSVRCPQLVSRTTAPTLVYAAFESLRRFQFDPAGTPSRYELTIDFQPPRQ